MPLPTRPPASPAAAAAQERFHADVLKEVVDAVNSHDVVVVGMAVNPAVKKAHQALQGAGIAFHKLNYGGYGSMWRPRLAIKLWSGWPTFPQVFVKGQLVGGGSDAIAALADGSLQAMLAGERPAPQKTA